MITLAIYKTGTLLTGFKLSGHSGFGESGRDVVCAAVSSAARLVECAISDVLKLKADIVVNEDKALLELKLPEEGAFSPECRVLLEAFCLYMTELEKEYPHNIKIRRNNQ